LLTTRRPPPGSRVLDLTRRLAEEYASVPLPAVRRAVRDAADLVGWAADGSAERLALLERLARVELGSLTSTAQSA
jgi:hypothetical protein